MALELYNFPASTCSQKVRLCLHEKGLAFTDRILLSSKGEHLTPEYLALNPNGVVPTLVHDGIPIVDSSVILEYLDEVFPQISMMPTGAVARASSQMASIFRRSADRRRPLSVLQPGIAEKFSKYVRGRIRRRRQPPAVAPGFLPAHGAGWIYRRRD
ncbi:MAG: glutathione S-transferase N-terminal domain-containing protein [Rhodospirillales bacterium]|jgi:glutathione S-transferase|nr:hypothetical protein [Rhodospirillaceae bacterium]MDP6427167.1 glutathione S-transferase N-terminal domain-containing protein [Rhodospirillales bacterium]MDP6646561.1 glutathione S-transferase N-terminal domain-containing protein [Rhodospirillales bacterium]MDP6840966.1 glutathione S-transferase N-terminal domain-containing protein [Rhodospirillales bacterium]|tara:strand:- start:196 stop:666 length:471 start_codon:yes stop_codon:yes gene_type:complete